MKIEINDKVDPKSYDKVVDLLVEHNLSKTSQVQNEINKPIEIITRNEKDEIIEGLYWRSI